MKNAFLFTLLLAFLACTENGFDPQKFAGTYAGTWSNGAASGPASIVVVTNTDGTFDLVLDFDGNYLGLGDPPPNPMSGTYDDDGAKVKGSNPLYGNCDVTINTKGDMTGIFTDVAMGMFPKLTYAGTITAEKLTSTYDVHQTDGTVTQGTLNLTKQ